MPEHPAPGVYVEEVSVRPRPEGVSTGTAGFVGETERGPVTPILVTSWTNYCDWFGGCIGPDSSCPTETIHTLQSGGVAPIRR